MKKKIFIVVADYYKDISTGLLNSAKTKLKNSYTIKIIRPKYLNIKVLLS